MLPGGTSPLLFLTRYVVYIVPAKISIALSIKSTLLRNLSQLKPGHENFLSLFLALDDMDGAEIMGKSVRVSRSRDVSVSFNYYFPHIHDTCLNKVVFCSNES